MWERLLAAKAIIGGAIMRDAYIVTSIRTPGCKRNKGAFKDTRPEDLLTFILNAAVEQTQNLEKRMWRTS
jgi:acetyl-CoA acetyltransferase